MKRVWCLWEIRVEVAQQVVGNIGLDPMLGGAQGSQVEGEVRSWLP